MLEDGVPGPSEGGGWRLKPGFFYSHSQHCPRSSVNDVAKPFQVIVQRDLTKVKSRLKL
jgi:hypothetical protein